MSRRRFALTAGVSLPDALTVAAARRYAIPPAPRQGRW
jgi:hypothetical protein